MSVPESEVESLVARCVDAGEAGYRAELERIAGEHPEAAVELRQRIAKLEELGFLGSRRSSATHWLPDEVGGYRLAGLLGRGGMGVVFRGSKPGGDEVAIKIVRPDLLADERTRERFRREAMLATRLAHPGICPVLEVGIDDDVPYLVMPLLHGRTFGAWLRAERRDRSLLFDVLAQAARALDAAHAAGLVHRDVTPGNLFVTDDGRAIVLDFGLARDTTGAVATLTGSHDQLGTLPYMAPEQLRGGSVDRRTDVYALGVVAYEAIAGRLPFVASQRSDVSRRILGGDAPRLGRITSGVSRPLERVVQTAMDLEPARRYATALEFADDLARLRAGQPVAAHGIGPWLRARRWAAHHPVATTAMLLLSLLLGVAAAFVVQLSSLLRVQEATEQALLSRTLEQADPMRALERALAAYDGAPSPATLGQLNRLLHQVTMLATRSVLPGPVRRLAVHRADDANDLVAVATESGVSLLRLDRGSGTMQIVQQIPVPGELSDCLLRCVRFSPSGRFVGFGGTGKMAFVVAVGSDTVRQLSGSNGEVLEVAVDDDGNVWGTDATGRLLHWPAGEGNAEGRPLLDLVELRLFDRRYGTHLRGMREGPGGDLLLWNFDYALRVQRDGSLVWTVPPVGDKDVPAVAAIDAARGRVLLVQQGRLRLHDWSNGKELWNKVLKSPAKDAAIADDGVIASLHDDGTLRFWSTAGDAIAEYRDPQDHLGTVMCVPLANAFLAVGYGGTQVRVDTAGRAVRMMNGGDVDRLGLPGPFASSSDGSILVAGGGPGQVRSWDFDGSRGAAQARLVASPPVGLSAHPDRRQLLVYTHDQNLWSWLPGTAMTPLGKLPLTTYVSRNQVAPGEPVVIGGRVGLKPRVALFDAERGTFHVPFQQVGQYAVVGAARLRPEHLLVALGDNRFASSRLQVFRADGDEMSFEAAKRRNWEVPLSTGRVTCMDASADGRRLVLGCVAGGLHEWELPDQAWEKQDDDRPPRSVKSALTNGRVWSVDMSADGRFVVAGIQDGSVLTWDLDRATTTLLVKPRGRAARSSLVDDDRLVVEFAPDGLVRLWDAHVEPAEKVFEVMAGDGAVVRDAVLLCGPVGPDVRGADRTNWQLATVSSDGWLRLWSLNEAAVVKKARQRLLALEQH